MKKKVILIPLVFLVAIILFSISCTAPTPEPTPTPTPTPTPSPSPTPTPSPPQQEVIELTVSYYMPPPTPGVFGQSQAIQNWAQKIEEETNGRVVINIYPSGTLLKLEDSYQGVVDGIADITHFSPHTDPAAFKLFSVFLLPGLDWPSPDAKYWVVRELFSEFPELKAEFKDVEILAYSFTSAPLLSFAKDTVVRTPADLKGMKISLGSAYVPYIEALGAAAVPMSPADRYLAMEKGVIDGQVLPWAAIKAFRSYEVTKSYTDKIGLHESISCEVINKQVWENLPPDIREVFIRWNDWLGFETSRGTYCEDEQGIKAALESGGKIYTPTPEEFKLWSEALKPFQDDWVQKREAEGLPGRAILDAMLRLIDKYNQCGY